MNNLETLTKTKNGKLIEKWKMGSKMKNEFFFEHEQFNNGYLQTREKEINTLVCFPLKNPMA